MSEYTLTDRGRFLSLLSFKETGCVEFCSSQDKDGYAQFTFGENGRHVTRRAHRVAFEIFKGDIPDNLFICHTCDNPPCVNPAHLWAGTQFDNERDKTNKKRRRQGIDHPGAVHTEAQIRRVKELIAQNFRPCDIARETGVHRNTIYEIKRGRIWRNVICAP